METNRDTPWRRAFHRLGLPAADLARVLGVHRSSISRALQSETGLIPSEHQKRIIDYAREKGVAIKASDLLPL